MSKGLETLECGGINVYTKDYGNCFAYTQDCIDIILKELMAFDIIKNKSVDMSTFGAFETYNDYEHFYDLKFHIKDGWDKLDEEEFELLKKVLEE